MPTCRQDLRRWRIAASNSSYHVNSRGGFMVIAWLYVYVRACVQSTQTRGVLCRMALSIRSIENFSCYKCLLISAWLIQVPPQPWICVVGAGNDTTGQYLRTVACKVFVLGKLFCPTLSRRGGKITSQLDTSVLNCVKREMCRYSLSGLRYLNWTWKYGLVYLFTLNDNLSELA